MHKSYRVKVLLNLSLTPPCEELKSCLKNKRRQCKLAREEADTYRNSCYLRAYGKSLTLYLVLYLVTIVYAVR